MANENNIVIKTERKWGCLGFLLVFAVGIIVGFFCAMRHFRDATKMLVERDTTYIHDTTRILLPKEIKYIKTTDTLRVLVKDTVVLRDTTYVVLQKEEKEYRGEDYYAKVSGYKPSLDYIEVYPKTTIIRKTETIIPNKNSLSLGMNVGYLNTPSIPIYLEYERMLHKNVDFHARLLYDLPLKSFGAEVGASLNIGW